MRTLAILALTVLAAVPFAARSQTSSSPPVVVNSCGPMLTNNNSTQSVFGVPLASTSSGIKIQFTNESSKTANLINFAVNSNGDSFVIRDVGTFSPGVEITHRYRNGEGQAFVLPQFVSPKVTCTVRSVHFSDGSVWRQGMAQASTAPAAGGAANTLTVSPANVEMDTSADAHLFMVTSAEKVAAYSERNTCRGIASVTLSVTGEAAATYTVRPIAPGSCVATIQDEAGHTATVPITVH